MVSIFTHSSTCQDTPEIAPATNVCHTPTAMHKGLRRFLIIYLYAADLTVIYQRHLNLEMDYLPQGSGGDWSHQSNEKRSPAISRLNCRKSAVQNCADKVTLYLVLL